MEVKSIQPPRLGTSNKKDKRGFNCRTRFVNLTYKRIEAIWINYDGVLVKYKTLEPQEHFDVTSYFDNGNLPWMFRDSETHTKLIANFKTTSPELVTITQPLLSLYEYSLELLQKCLRNPQDAFLLNIPGGLQRELSEKISEKMNNRF